MASTRDWLLDDSPSSRLQARLGRAYVAWRRFSANRLALVGLLIIVALIVIAALAGTIPYELLCAISQRVPLAFV